MGLIRLQENFSVSKEDMIPYPIQEEAGSEPLVESVQGKSYSCISRYRVPVSKINTPTQKNLNGRAYTKPLWENVINTQKAIWEGCVGLADHPSGDSDGSVRDIFAVWHNLGMNESKGIVEADLHLVGPYGKLAEDVIQAGGKLGFSSSGFGELLEDGSTVNPKTYMLERISDWVLTPSQEVYGTQDMKIKNESVEKTSTNIIIETKENQMPGTKISKREERRFREDVENFLASSLTIKDPKEKLSSLQELHSYFEEEGVSAVDLKEKVEAAIAETESKIDSILKDHIKLNETFGIDSSDQLKESLDRVVQSKKLVESQSRDWKKVSETLQTNIQSLKEELASRPSTEAYENSISFNRRVRISFLEKKKELLAQVATLEEQIEGQKVVLAKMKELASASVKAKKLAEAQLQRALSLLESTKKENETIKKTLAEKVVAAKKAKITESAAPKVATRVSSGMAVEFTEKKEVEAYWKDIYSRHGKDVLPIRERVLGSKTLQEAMRLYTNYLPRIQEVMILPSNIDEQTRREYLREATHREIAEPKRSLKLPKTWV